MHGLEHEVALGVDLLHALAGGGAPGHEDDAACALGGHEVDDALGEAFPAAVGVAVCLVGAHGEAGVEHEHAAVGPGGEEAGVFGGRRKGGVVLLEAGVHVLEGGRGGGWCPDGEGEAVGLVVVVVGVLADDDDLDGVEGGMSGPVGGC